MKYPELVGKCKTCLYKCGRLELPEFKGVYRCDYYIGGDTNGHDNRRHIENNEEII